MLNPSITLDHHLSLHNTPVFTEVISILPAKDSKTILFVVENPVHSSRNVECEGINIQYTSVDEVSHLLDPLSRKLFIPDVIVVSSELENYTDRYLNQLHELATSRSIPFILHSEKFDQISKNIAVEFGFDEYYSGSISSDFVKKADFIKKLKKYKHTRGNKPYKVATLQENVTLKMWPLKRAFDILISSSILILISPLLLLIALMIKIESKGPILYISKRAGNGYKIFNFYKFRSMRTGADEELKNLAHLNQYGDSLFYKISNDPRITKLGSFLRNTSLDELPQLYNVLKGDMSLVGNRPLPLYEAEKLTKDQIAWRFLAPAGITGLWQITKRGRDEMSEDERIQLDMQYAMKNSFWFDLKILLSTVPVMLQKERV